MGTASGSNGQIPGFMQRRIKGLALLLRTSVLPVRTERVTECAFPLALRTAFKLLY